MAGIANVPRVRVAKTTQRSRRPGTVFRRRTGMPMSSKFLFSLQGLQQPPHRQNAGFLMPMNHQPRRRNMTTDIKRHIARKWKLNKARALKKRSPSYRVMRRKLSPLHEEAMQTRMNLFRRNASPFYLPNNEPGSMRKLTPERQLTAANLKRYKKILGLK